MKKYDPLTNMLIVKTNDAKEETITINCLDSESSLKKS